MDPHANLGGQAGGAGQRKGGPGQGKGGPGMGKGRPGGPPPFDGPPKGEAPAAK
jgi:translation initiation factor IF-2